MIDLEEIVKVSNTLNLLYVEDSEEVRTSTLFILRELFSQITVAVDGKDGLEKFKLAKYDLIITDLNMPNMNGNEMISKIRKVDLDIPIIVLSAHNEMNYFINSINSGINDYLEKPIVLENFLNTLNNIIFHKNQYKTNKLTDEEVLEKYDVVNENSVISIIDGVGIIKYINQEFCEVFECNKEDVIGMSYNEITKQQQPKDLLNEIWTKIKIEKSIWKGTIRYVSNSGKEHFLKGIIKPILDENGTILEYIAIRENITDSLYKRWG